MAQVIGGFVFKNDGDGCLTAKWVNRNELTSYPEACKLISKKKNASLFEGTYKSTWVETGTNVEMSTLTITCLPSGVYDLQWLNSNTSKIMFTGRAMLYGDLLIGSYWD